MSSLYGTFAGRLCQVIFVRSHSPEFYLFTDTLNQMIVRHTKLIFILLFWVVALLIILVQGALAVESKCLQRPIPGHAVEVIDLHPTDNHFVKLKEVQQLQLILMEPGICLNESKNGKNGPWFRARVFIHKSGSATFSHRGVIKLEAGKFK